MDEHGNTDVARGTIQHAKWQYNRAPDVSLLGVLALGVVAAIVIGWLRYRSAKRLRT